MNFAEIFSSSRIVMTASAADAATVSGSDAGLYGCGGTQMWTLLIMYGAIGLIFYFLIYRPQKKRRQQEETLRSNVEVGDEIITIGGICGRVVSIKEDDVIVIETGADRTKLKMKTWSISSNETAKARQAEIDASKPKQEKTGFFANLFGKKNEENK